MGGPAIGLRAPPVRPILRRPWNSRHPHQPAPPRQNLRPDLLLPVQELLEAEGVLQGSPKSVDLLPAQLPSRKLPVFSPRADDAIVRATMNTMRLHNILTIVAMMVFAMTGSALAADAEKTTYRATMTGVT